VGILLIIANGWNSPYRLETGGSDLTTLAERLGVFYHKKSISWDVIWMDEGVRKTKCFSVSKYGTAAYTMACSFRDATINNLNLEGAGYADGHGK
jgi:hypothetical protein